MKVLILITLSIVSLSAFSADLGENPKSDCPLINQSSDRSAKAVTSTESVAPKEDVKVLTK